MNAAAPSRATKLDETPSEFEGEIREFIRRDVAHLRRAPNEGAEQAVNGIHSLLDRVSGSSVSEIDSLIADLRNVREFLKSEGERVQTPTAGANYYYTDTFYDSQFSAWMASLVLHCSVFLSSMQGP